MIGTHAKDVYNELVQILDLDESAQPEIRQSLANRVIATMSAVFAPLCLCTGGGRTGTGRPYHFDAVCSGLCTDRDI